MAYSNGTPETFKCAVGGEWLASDKFSRNQISKWQKVKRDDGVTPANAGLICKEHTQQTAAPREIRCNGPCGLWKHRDHFSKTQRNDPNAQCIPCTLWVVNFNGDEAPHGAPNSQLLSHEIQAQATGVQSEAPTIASPRSAVGDRPSGVLSDYQQARIHGVEVGEVDTMVVQSAFTMQRGVDSTGSPANSDHRGPVSPATSDVNPTDNGKPQSVAGSTAPADEPADEPAFRLYGYSPFAPAAGKSVEKATKEESAGDSELPPMVPNKQPGKKWFKGDTRKVFFAPPAYAARPTDQTNLRCVESDSSDSDSD
ncbi:Stc1 domain-containing protein [Daldinia vernicosa]|uniref:Stc1 domain-containing protein n=1 Tax=Daldinia vernicosa TaxID=114800 RepID=UPI002007B869|nr:Stc1 domain-containing protein [Daldinia vernicosa]KAI0852086.1 Stc1 domain-containing protein [Daldinia vernicosa]